MTAAISVPLLDQLGGEKSENQPPCSDGMAIEPPPVASTTCNTNSMTTAIFEPSGLHTGSPIRLAPMVVSCVSPVPSGAITHTSPSFANAMRVPSGDHLGPEPVPENQPAQKYPAGLDTSVSFDALAPSASAVQISDVCPYSYPGRKAICPFLPRNVAPAGDAIERSAASIAVTTRTPPIFVHRRVLLLRSFIASPPISYSGAASRRCPSSGFDGLAHVL